MASDGERGGIPPFGEVEVWSSYEGTWVGGFELAEIPPAPDGSGYLIRRRSDGVILPARFEPEHVRRCDPGSAPFTPPR